jgi:hypothetical protein
MARPRVFVSSTFYDLQHIRSSLDVFIDSLGYDSILSEKGDIAYSHEMPLDESCYREVSTADIFVLVIGGRYGSPASRKAQGSSSTASENYYESVTKLEHSEALKRDIPIYILVESRVYAEYETYLNNIDSKSTIKYAHVNSVNVFKFLEEILSRPRNNPIKTFERFSDIEIWLREQWAGLFRDHLHRKSSQQQIKALADQVTALQEVAKTLEKYLENVLQKVSPNDAAGIIEQERKRMRDVNVATALQSEFWVKVVTAIEQQRPGETMVLDKIRNAIAESESFEDFGLKIDNNLHVDGLGSVLASSCHLNNLAREQVNQVRTALGLSTLDSPLPAHDYLTNDVIQGIIDSGKNIAKDTIKDRKNKKPRKKNLKENDKSDG